MFGKFTIPRTVGIFALLAFLTGCGSQRTTHIQKVRQEVPTWSALSVSGVMALENEERVALEGGVASAISPIQEKRSAEARELQHNFSGTPGFRPHLVANIDRSEIYRLSDQAWDPAFVAIVSITERGVAHVYQQNLLYVGIVSARRVVPVMTIIGDEVTPEGVAMYESLDGRRIRLFLITTGPIFQGVASTDLTGWEVDVGSSTVTELFTVSGPENYVKDDTIEVNVTSDGATIIKARLDSNPELRGDDSEWDAHLHVMSQVESVDITLNQDGTAVIRIP